MGLLDDFAGFIKTPEGQGLLSGAAGWAAGARKGTPWNNVGRGGLAGIMGYGNALEQQMQAGQAEQAKALRDMQIAEMRRKQTAMQGLEGQLPEEMRNLFAVAPEIAAKQMFKEPEKPQLVTIEGLDGRPMQRWLRPGEAQGVDIGAAPNKEAALPWYAKKGPDGRLSIDPAFAELEKTKAAFGRPPAQPMAPVAYVDPVSGQTVWGTITDARGKPAANFNPMVAGQVAQAKGYGTETGKGQADAVANLPKAIANGENALSQIEALRKHPGFGIAVGKSAMLGTQKIPGTEGYDFVNRLEQLKGGAFLTAFETLKGGGQITEVEGKKATAAIARMDNATSEKEFKSALDDYEKVIKTATNNAKMRAGKVKPAPAAGKGGSGEWSDL